MEIQSLTQLGTQTLEIVQSAVFPVIGVCLVVSVLFFMVQIIFSFSDFNLQFLVKLILVIGICGFMAKSFVEKYVEYSKAVFQSAPGLVR